MLSRLATAVLALSVILPVVSTGQEETSASPSPAAQQSSGSNVLVKSEGTATVLVQNAQSSAADSLNSSLAPGTVVSTGEDGTVVIQLQPGVVVQLQPQSQIVIGETLPGGSEDALGNPIPLVSITINSGTIVLITTENGLASVALQVVTPRGIVATVIPGQTVISVTGTDPATSTVTVSSVSGAEMVTTVEGETVPVGEGLAVVLRPDGTYTVTPLLDLPDGQGIISTAQNASDNVGGLNLDPGSPPPPPVPPPEPPLPPDPPRPTPTPTPQPVSP